MNFEDLIEVPAPIVPPTEVKKRKKAVSIFEVGQRVHEAAFEPHYLASDEDLPECFWPLH